MNQNDLESNTETIPQHESSRKKLIKNYDQIVKVDKSDDESQLELYTAEKKRQSPNSVRTSDDHSKPITENGSTK